MTSTSYAQAVREGAMVATRLHMQLGLQDSVQKNLSNIDVFNAIFAVGPPLLLRPLNGLLGAYLNSPIPGILVTTQRPMSVQRFTAAHELGHFMFGHTPSLDDENILRRSSVTVSTIQDFQELEANSFAVNFMMPRWLIHLHLRNQGWKVQDLHFPSKVYQLSLRIGASYEATCWTLVSNNLISQTTAVGLLRTTPKDIKLALLRQYKPEDYRGDVWLLTKRDAGSRIEGSRNDLFVLRLEEHSGGGYLWNLDQLKRSGFVILDDSRDDHDEEEIGSTVRRRITAKSETMRQGVVSISESRPWEADEAINKISFAYDFTGPEEEGISRVERRNLLEAA